MAESPVAVLTSLCDGRRALAIVASSGLYVNGRGHVDRLTAFAGIEVRIGFPFFSGHFRSCQVIVFRLPQISYVS